MILIGMSLTLASSIWTVAFAAHTAYTVTYLWHGFC